MIKKLQSRLSRQNISLSLSEIREQIQIMNLDIDNLREDDLQMLSDHFMSQHKALIPVDESDIIEVDLPTSSEILEAVEEQKNQLATTTKSELISQAANNLNIELSTTEIEAIATNFNASYDDFTTTLDELKLAILAFIDHKIQCNLMIANTVDEIYGIASAGFESNNQHLNNSLSQFNKALNQQSADFKSRLKHACEVSNSRCIRII
jgi:uncharacterized protein YukE